MKHELLNERHKGKLLSLRKKASPSNLCANQFVIQRSQLTKKGCSMETGHVCENRDIRHAHPHKWSKRRPFGTPTSPQGPRPFNVLIYRQPRTKGPAHTPRGTIQNGASSRSFISISGSSFQLEDGSSG